jgi:hypothetical protein
MPICLFGMTRPTDSLLPGVTEDTHCTVRGRSLAEVLREHAVWLENNESGWRANFSGLTLNDLELPGANL